MKYAGWLLILAGAGLAIGTIIAQHKVIMGQQQTIRLMITNPACTVAPTPVPQDDDGAQDITTPRMPERPTVVI
jgi:hypothetical protein